MSRPRARDGIRAATPATSCQSAIRSSCRQRLEHGDRGRATVTSRSASYGDCSTRPERATARCSRSTGNVSPGSGGANTRPELEQRDVGIAVRGVVRDRAQQHRARNAGRSTDSSARSGFSTSIDASSVRSRRGRDRRARRAAACTPRRSRRRRARRRPARRSRCTVVSAPIFSGFDGTVRRIWSRPMRRATSSTRSISRSMSGRHVGTIAVPASTSMPSGVSRRSTSDVGEVGGQQLVHPVGADRHVRALDRLRVHVDHAGRRARSRNRREQLHRARGARRDVVGIDTTLEARARLRSQPEPLRGLGDTRRLEVRRLEQDLGGRRRTPRPRRRP